MASLSPAARPFLLRLDPDVQAALDASALSTGQTRTGLTNELLGAALRVRSERSVDVESVPSEPGMSARQVHIRLSAADYAVAESRAHGWRSVAAWCSSFIRAELRSGAAPVSDDDRALLAASIRELRRLGVNLNQIAHRLNSDVRYQSGSVDAEGIGIALRAIERHVEAVTRTFAAVEATPGKE